jgi:hypothetical protein
MKKLIIRSLFLASLFASPACKEDTINIDPIGYTEAGFFESEQDFDWAVKGVYNKIGNYYAFQGDPGNVVQALWLLPGDDLTSRGTAFTEDVFTGLNGSNTRINRFYTLSYQAIQRANTLLEKIEQNGERVFTVNPQNKDRYRGEALFLRSYVYFMLWNVFGTAPLVTARLTDAAQAAALVNSTGTQLLDQAIADLQTAAELLPNAWDANNQGRATKNAAYGLRAKALVFRATLTASPADYTAAIADIDKIGSNGAEARSLVSQNVTRGAVVVPAYERNFNPNDENNAESLFEFQANNSPNNANPFVGLDDFATIAEMGNYVGYFNQLPSWANERYYTATQSVYDAYPEEDPRRAINFKASPVFTGSAPNVDKYVRNFAGVSGPNGGALGLSVTNPRILRLADVLLLKAEAIVLSEGNLTEAVELINRIRERARKSTPTGMESPEPANRPLGADKVTVLEWIFQERRLELAFEEGHRWFDLRRRFLAADPLVKIDLSNWDWQSVQQPIVSFQNFNVNFPLPDSEVQQTALEQNPGY